jgi:hypothetical protein
VSVEHPFTFPNEHVKYGAIFPNSAPGSEGKPVKQAVRLSQTNSPGSSGAFLTVIRGPNRPYPRFGTRDRPAFTLANPLCACAAQLVCVRGAICADIQTFGETRETGGLINMRSTPHGVPPLVCVRLNGGWKELETALRRNLRSEGRDVTRMTPIGVAEQRAQAAAA